MRNPAIEQKRRDAVIEDAVLRGQRALQVGDAQEGVHWLDRAHRLAPNDGTLLLALASALLSVDPRRAARLYRRLLGTIDIGAAWFGLAAAELRSGSARAAREALHSGLSRHAPRPDFSAIADQIAEANGAPGWCGLRADGTIVARSANGVPVQIRVDGRLTPSLNLPDGWRRASKVAVMAGRRPLIGSPISTRAISRIEGTFERSEGRIRGWAWHPGDPAHNPLLSITIGDQITTLTATTVIEAPPDMRPLAMVRSFEVALPATFNESTTVAVRGLDGEPLSIHSLGNEAATPDTNRWPREWSETAIIVTHDDGGGVARRVETAISDLKRRGRSVIVLKPAMSDDGRRDVRVEVGDGTSAPGEVLRMPDERETLLNLLRSTAPTEVRLHHLLNHDAAVVETVRTLGIPYDAYVHDHIWFCPRIALVGPDDRYCGEPSMSECEVCVRSAGSFLNDDLSVAAHLALSEDILAGARSIIAPSHDAARRMNRHFPGLRVKVVPHESDRLAAEPPPVQRTSGTARICLAGAIGLHKGYQILLALARDARERDLPLEFRVAGTTIDDQRLMDTGRVFVTGPYEPSEAVALIKAQNASLALLPSIWPETWCLALSELWRAGLRVAAFDIGAPAERIRATGRGFLLPLGLSAVEINDSLMSAVSERSVLPVRAFTPYKSDNATTQSK
jgi:glycosyltransferase involved in cell wall biosynthesis